MGILHPDFPKSNPGMIIMMPLTKGFFSTIDVQDVDLSDMSWIASQTADDRVYVTRGNGAARVWLHRVIMERIAKRSLLPTEFVDHIDGNPLNNRRSNLRIATNFQNMHNRHRQRNNTSGFKGVHSSGRVWVAKISVNRRFIYLGRFPDAVSAAKAYNKAALEHYGEFAVLNDIPESQGVE